MYIFFGISLFLSTKKKAVLEKVFRKTGHPVTKDRSPRLNRISIWLQKNYLDIDPASFVIIYTVSSGLIFSLMLTFGLNIFLSFSGMVLLSLLLFLIIKARKKKIYTENREQLEILLNSLMANLYANPNLLTGLQNTVKSLDYPLRPHIERLIDRTRSGVLLSDAIKMFIEESDDPAMEKIFLGFIASNDKGFELIEFIRMQLDHLRQSHNIQKYIEILSTGPRYTSYLIMIIPVIAVIIVCIINRGFTGILFSRPGIFVISYSVISYTTGFYLIRRLINSIRKRSG